MSPRQPRQIIIIGAGRSGTKLLRDLIAIHPKINKVPYDINFIWRMGNENLKHDELRPSQLSRKNKENIRKYFNRFQESAHAFVEKTVSNSLRVPYVAKIFPDALFIHLFRDGRDVIESAYRQWAAPPNWPYIIRKIMFFPLHLAPRYAIAYAFGLVRKLGMESNSASWGPRYKGIDDDLKTKDLLEVCSIQWVKSVEKAEMGLNMVPPEAKLEIRYEEFVTNPLAHLLKMSDKLHIPSDIYELTTFGSVTTDNIGKWKKILTEEQIQIVHNMAGSTLQKFGYY